MKKIIYPVILFAVLAGCNSKESREIKSTSVSGVKITKQEVRLEKEVQYLDFSGTIEPSQTIPLSFRTTGTVEKVLVEEGDFVKEGQLLAVVDDTDAQTMYEISLSKYQQATDAYDRLKSVYDKGSLPEIKWIEMETNLAQAKSTLELSKNNLEKCKLFAPANGIIGNRNIEPGMSAINISGSPLEIVDIKTVNIKIPVPENEISKIKKGLAATITVSALGNKKYEGTITNVSQVADRFSRTYDAKILVTNTDFELKPGMVCDVRLHIQLDEFSVLVPYPSVSEDSDGNSFVYLVDATNKRAKKQIVKTGNFVGSDIEIISGLTEGQEVVCKGNNKLMDNSLITW
ncbi:MAG: efflux RND transporter periplasmic adaptor subunit [Mariniphaga sp.]|nr:efflux RND transporter periplasmic adaptor subunit [Mariniphaga sp.]